MAEKKQVNLGPVDKIALGQGFCFVVEGQEIAVFRPRNGEMCAIANRCPHRQAPLADGIIDDTQVVCPYHGHKFNFKTGAGSEVKEQVAVYSVLEKDGQIILEME